ncbi:hypothetical protein OpiT1DRAFT_04063 [Opitutaceae bacterium TAV1]|nr:hypothetical protein OpiT1DRAFT_04063 [Opitutaceae bacterium TAV1]
MPRQPLQDNPVSIRKKITGAATPATGGIRADILHERGLVWPRIGAVALAAMVLAGIAAMLRFPAAGLMTPLPADAPRARGERAGTPAFTLRLRGEGEAPALRDQIALFDPTPLFLPSPLSSAYLVPPRETGGDEDVAAFGQEPPLFIYNMNALNLPLPGRQPLPADARAWLASHPAPDLYRGLGQRDASDFGGTAFNAPLPERLAAVEAANASDGRVVARFDILRDPGAGATRFPPGAGPWEPAAFLVKVEPAGLAGMPQVIKSSGNAERDEWLAGYLARTAFLGARLAPGFYEVRVGP